MIETLLLTAASVASFNAQILRTRASGFFFMRDQRLFLVTSRHVLIDEASQHFPDRIEIELHVDADNLAVSTGFSLPLYRDGGRLWREAQDGGSIGDVAVLEIDRAAWPANALFRAFTPNHLVTSYDQIEVGSSLLVLGFPLGFQDTLHHLPVVRQAAIASSFGLRFQGQGYFLTDARTHRGTSGAPVVMRALGDMAGQGDLPWWLLGIHSARLDVGRDQQMDEALGLNCAWYADILMQLTAPA
ncbi:MAG: trypsin [Candidatus Dactylopiibacterium carminicum]|uniref:Serine protease n=1 Tax=Candidatus Dactylopiibacterium carminicum TaxID=857335 RepID=A0A272ERK1_9RHOO|nr:serine protease [Candidatus Dactylopiibacterium carminicum]KAF7598811.1 serine protease [Candidatus Dactylopiibacterium carminicum]PAS92733.1 MAG: trypsin [Candidatus Dactylopiibacterium carminicum]PAS98833.1 MAG: trypsin [Candidatus Dactylopiibacterium carminicum]